MYFGGVELYGRTGTIVTTSIYWGKDVTFFSELKSFSYRGDENVGLIVLEYCSGDVVNICNMRLGEWNSISSKMSSIGYDGLFVTDIHTRQK
jgi:hypothetical protein